MTLLLIVIAASFAATVTFWLLVQCVASYVRTWREERARDLATGSWRDDDTVDYGDSTCLSEQPTDCEIPVSRFAESDRQIDDDWPE